MNQLYAADTKAAMEVKDCVFVAEKRYIFSGVVAPTADNVGFGEDLMWKRHQIS